MPAFRQHGPLENMAVQNERNVMPFAALAIVRQFFADSKCRSRTSGFGGGFNRSTQHVLIELLDEEVRAWQKNRRPGLFREQKTALWERWKIGPCSSDIARALERTRGAIHHILAVSPYKMPPAPTLTRPNTHPQPKRMRLCLWRRQ